MGILPVQIPEPFEWVRTPNDDKASFCIIDSSHVPLVGKVVYVRLPWDTTLSELHRWKGKHVLLDGRNQIVNGIEAYCIERQRAGNVIGLLIKRV